MWFKKIVLMPKKAPGPNSSIKKYPLLYLYFDNFEEITENWQNGNFEAARDIDIVRVSNLSLDQVMHDEVLFIYLYENNLLRIKLHDGTCIFKKEEDFYWEQVEHLNENPSFSSNPDPEFQEYHRNLMASVARVVEAIKLRYGLINSTID